jgi:cobalt-zinc-cadmium efflux system outer membrane protein
MRNRYPRGLALFLLLAARASAQEITERELVQRFLAASPHVQELTAGVAALRAETRGWSLWPNPAAGYSREGAGLTQFLQVEQTLPVSGRLGQLQRAGAAAVDSAQSQAEFARWELVSELRSAFYALLTAQERETAVHANLDRLDEILKVLRTREQEGEGSAYDRLRAERERSEVETEIAAIRIGTAQARSRLATFLSRGSVPDSFSAKGSLASVQPIPTPQALLAKALEARGDYKAERAQIAGFGYRRQAAERLRIPEPSVAAGVKRAQVGSGMANGSFVALSVPLPLFNRGKSEVNRYQAETERAQFRRQAIELRISAEIDGARKTLELRRAVLSDYQRRVEEQGRQLEQIARTAYQEGEIGILELLDAYRLNLQSRLRSLEFTSAAKQAEIDLERVVGAPVLNQEVLP